MSARHITGRFCRRVVAPKGRFAPRSFRWVQSGRGWVLIGCPKGYWKRNQCEVGTKAYEVLAKSNKRCPAGQHAVRKG